MRNDYDAGDQEYDDEGYGGDGLRWMSVLVVGLVVLGFFSLAWYAYQTGGQTTTQDGVPVVEAAGGVLKEKPADPGGMNFPDRDKTVYSAVGSGVAPTTTEEHLTEAPEEPIAERGKVEKPADGTTVFVREKEGEKAATGAAMEEDDSNKEIAAQIDQFEKQMAAEPTPAAVAADPAAAAPAAPTANEQSVEAKLQAELAPQTAAPTPAASAPEAAPAAPAAAAPAALVAETTPVPDAPLQQPAPSVIAQQQAQAAQAAKQTAPAVTKAAPAKDTVKTPVASGATQIQIAAARSKEDAERAWKAAAAKHSVLAGLGHTVVSAEVPGKGTFYRLRATGLSAASAASVCAQLKGAGQDCMVVK